MYELVGSESWAPTTVFNLARWKNGLAFKNINFSSIGKPVIKIAELKAGVTAQTKFTEDDYDESVLVRLGDMLFSWSGNPDTSIDVFRWDGPEGWLNQHIYKVTPAKGVDEKFLFFLLRWLRPRFAEIARNKQTTGLGHVTLQDFRNMHVGLPEITEQYAIVAVVSPIQDKIDLNRKMNATLESMARALFRDWFVDFGPTRAKMEGREPYLAQQIWDMFPDKLDEDGKPEGWEAKPLTEFFSILGGGTPKTSNADFWDGPIPWFSVTDTPAAGSVFVTKTEKTVTEAGLKGSSARLVPKGTTIISARGTVGNLAVTGRDMTFNQSCYGLQGAGAIGDYATYLIAQNMVTQLQAMAHGSVFSTITRQTFEAISLPMPSPKVLSAFEDAVSSMFNQILANVSESRTLAQTRDLLLPKLMSGEIRVSDAELAAAEAE